MNSGRGAHGSLRVPSNFFARLAGRLRSVQAPLLGKPLIGGGHEGPQPLEARCRATRTAVALVPSALPVEVTSRPTTSMHAMTSASRETGVHPEAGMVKACFASLHRPALRLGAMRPREPTKSVVMRDWCLASPGGH